jgi:glycosyltransferase involved in cell wall biosynthesis
MKILILTQYFPPEVGAPQNRLFELAIRLKKKGADITVLTAMPNYPKMEIMEGYRGKYFFSEEMEGIKVFRAMIFVSKSKSILPRLLNYFSFVFSSFFVGVIKVKKVDYIFCESPPLFLGISAFWLKFFKNSKLIFNVSDLWPESAEKLGLVKNRLILNITTRLEEFFYSQSSIITGQTKGIVSNIKNRFPLKKVYWLPNGVDPEIFKYDNSLLLWREKAGFNSDDFIFLYAGIIGHAQGLEVILKAAANFRESGRVKFIILGNGPEKDKLLLLKDELKLDNVYFFDSVTKKEMPEIIQSVNSAIIPLKKLDLFKGAIPSKIFENLAMKKPILLGVEGEAKELFIDEANAGLFFEPEDHWDLTLQIKKLVQNESLSKELGNNGFNYVIKKFTRDKIATEFWDFLNSN